MLTEIILKNYRCFRDHTLPFKEETIIVGRNNAGKSTVIEGIRIISIITERYKSLPFSNVPDWLDIPVGERGVRVDLSGLGLSWENLFNHYGGPPASISAMFSNGTSITIYLGPERKIHAVIRGVRRKVVKSKAEARMIHLPRVSVLPQVAPLSPKEEIRRDEYVLGNMSSYLSSSHFRNQLNVLYGEYYEPFKRLVESTWPGLQIIELQGGAWNDDYVSLIVRDGDFAAEVAWMGHGLQMWLQTMWFLTRTSGHETIVLDEPDVYMHPDLQRKLLRFIRGKYPQCIIATHSTEILSETLPNNVLIVDRHKNESSFATTLPSVQKLAENIGSAQNLHLTRLWRSRRLLLFEGKDIKLLKRFQDLVFPNSVNPLDILPNMPIGGWSGWPYAVGSAMLLTNSVGEDIITYCILDSDYYTEATKTSRINEAKEKGIQLHIWNRKEIENYLIVPSAILRILNNRIPPNHQMVKQKDITDLIDQITATQKDKTIDSIAQEVYNQDRKRGIAFANDMARREVEAKWQTREGRILIVSGKNLISKLSAWSQEHYSVSFGVMTIAAEIRPGELDKEVVNVLTYIEECRVFDF